MSTPAKKDKVSTYFRPIEAVTVSNIKQMYDLYASYYDNTSLDIFLSDLSKKSGVILVSRKSDGKIVGFSTQTFFDLTVDGKRVRGIFSGDTIIEPTYWGNNALVTTFYRRVVIERIKRPFTPFYWFLISKGYKTYLLLSRNFPSYWPRFDQPTPPHIQQLIDKAATVRFGPAYDAVSGLVRFDPPGPRLADGIAPIPASPAPDIAFFAAKNPGHADGDELCCLGRVDLQLGLAYAKRLASKLTRRLRPGAQR